VSHTKPKNSSGGPIWSDGKHIDIDDALDLGSFLDAGRSADCDNVMVVACFVDIRGFTPAWDAMAGRQTKFKLSDFLAKYHRMFLEAVLTMRSISEGIWRRRVPDLAETLLEASIPASFKRLGDGMLLVWEVPDQRGKAVLEALYCAILDTVTCVRGEFVRIIDDLCDDVPTEIRSLRLGVGVASGDVLRLTFGNRDTEYVGSVLNLGARLQGVARPDGVRVQQGVGEALRAVLLARDWAVVPEKFRGLDHEVSCFALNGRGMRLITSDKYGRAQPWEWCGVDMANLVPLIPRSLIVTAADGMSTLRRPSAEDRDSLIELRRGVEVLTARRMAAAYSGWNARQRARALGALRSANDRLKAFGGKGNVAGMLRAGEIFHQCIATVAGASHDVFDVVKTLRRDTAEYADLKSALKVEATWLRKYADAVFREHQGILDAIATGHSDTAEGAVREHMHMQRSRNRDLEARRPPRGRNASAES